jgi:DNA recombination protein RmuC
MTASAAAEVLPGAADFGPPAAAGAVSVPEAAAQPAALLQGGQVPAGLLYGLLGFCGILVILLILLVIRTGRRSSRNTPLPGGAGSGEEGLQQPFHASFEAISRIERQLDQVYRIFTLPQVRGGVGEVLLSEILASWLPKRQYRLQYGFAEGTRADAVIFLGEYKVAVDAKFPLESLRSAMEEGAALPAEARRAFRTYVQDIASKYIRPSEGTLQFALMYIPSEKIYYRMFVQDEGSMLEEALRLGVVPAGPSGLFLYIQTVAYGLRGFSLPEEQRELARLLSQLRKDFDEAAKAFSVLGTHAKNLAKSYDETRRKIDRIEYTLGRLREGGAEREG